MYEFIGKLYNLYGIYTRTSKTFEILFEIFVRSFHAVTLFAYFIVLFGFVNSYGSRSIVK